MPHSNQPNHLRGWIVSHFGGFQALAAHLNLSTSTVSDWTTQNPRNMLKYSPEVRDLSDTTYDQIVEVVMKTESQLETAKV